MERKFKVGDRVVIQARVKTYFNGQTATVIGYRDDYPWPYPIYVIDHGGVGRDGIGICETALRPYYDGNDKVAWSECAWQPNKITAC